MVLAKQVFVLLLIIAISNSRDLAELSNGKSQSPATGEKKKTSPVMVQSRFSGLGGIMSQLFPGFNQGPQVGSATTTNPDEMGFPPNSQFYPGGTIQNMNPPLSSNPNTLDDAKNFPNINNPGMPQYPGQGFGASPQNQMPGHGIGGFPNMQNPNPGNLGGTPQIQYPDRVNAGMPMQFPNQNGFGGIPNTGYPNQVTYPGPGNTFGSTQVPYPNQGGFGGPSSQMPFPNQGNGGMTQMPYPSNMNGGMPQTAIPDQGNFGGATQPPYPGDFMGQQFPNNQNNFGPNDGTLDSMLPSTPFYPDLPSGGSGMQFPGPNQSENDGTSAILGRPVFVPPSNSNTEDKIVFPSSPDTPAQRQCVQDCQTTSEYNPVCGTNNITYINPGKFVCARNCGVEVYVSRRGRCPADMPNPINVLPTTRPLS